MKSVRNHAGMTFIEIMVAVLVLAVIGLGSLYFFAYGRGQVRLRNDYRLAGLLASEKLEQLMATAYDEISLGTTTEERKLEDRTFTRSYIVTDLGTVKQADVTVSWSYKNQTPEVSLTTQIAPQ